MSDIKSEDITGTVVEKVQDTISETDPESKITTTSSTTTTTTKTIITSNEDDLDDLDDLLDDFADDVLSKPPGSALETGTGPVGSGEDKKSTGGNANIEDAEFQNGIAELMKDLNIEDSDTKDQFEDLVKQFELNHREEIEAEEKKPGNFEYVMKETMERLKKSGETVDEKINNDASSANPEDMLSQLLAGLGGSGPGAGPGGDGNFDMSKLLVDMLEQLSSKEVLYEPIKDLNTKFPDYLKENKEKLSEFDYTKYNKQYDITNEILSVFDSPTYDDNNKDQREKVNTLLESLQELGQPPTELVGDSNDFPGLGNLGKTDNDALDFNTKDLPPNFEKELEEGCKQQ
ncbi:Pex19 protein family-domain-containing protein [Scheffersomyces amazonensis]|uniref:Pex19 protein family-domain-containing protein n=1 Tax=Scheffersomyces amazonensis TaxID=1078765 RepID=UPI00315D0C48